ncbi:MAG: uroporphyrinogen decarboxylase family protein [Armatimonadota bacterium]
MTPRERTFKVLRGEIPDRVPVMPGFGTWYTSRIYGGDLFDIEEGRLSATKMMSDLTRKYGCEMWFWQGYGDTISERSIDGKQESRVDTVKIDDDNYEQTISLITPSGTLDAVNRHNRYNPAVALTGYIKDPARDWPVYHEFMGDNWEYGTTTTLSDVPQEDLDLGVTTYGICLPVDFWKGLRIDTSVALMDLYDGIPEMEAAFEWHFHYSMSALTARMQIDPLPDMIHLQGSSSSLSMISPAIYERYNLAFINRACDIAHSKGVPVQIHHCGKSAKLVEILYNSSTVDVIHPLEPLPGGDVDLKVVKKRFGDRIILMGNLNTYQLMLYGTPAEVKEAARIAIDDAAEGGRFILSNGDQLGRDTPEENIMAMVEAAHEYGTY